MKLLGTFIDLFCGIGAFRQALASFGLRCVFSCDINETVRGVYLANYHEAPAGDVRLVSPRKLPEFDVLCGGFPCQSWSQAGDMEGFDDPRGECFFEIVRIAKARRPAVLFLENVRSLQGFDDGRALATIRSELERAGYSVSYDVLQPYDFGVPQHRPRLYIVCFRRDLGVTTFEFPKPTPRDRCLIDIAETTGPATAGCLLKLKNITWLHGDRQIEKILSSRQHRLVLLGGVDAIRDGNHLWFHQGNRIYAATGYTSAIVPFSGGRSKSTGIYLFPDGTLRMLGERECARAMGFGEDFIILGGRRVAIQYFGNSAVVPVLQAIFQEVLRALGQAAKERPDNTNTRGGRQ